MVYTSFMILSSLIYGISSTTDTTNQPSISPTEYTEGIWTDWYGGSGGTCSGIFEADGNNQRYEWINQICTRSGGSLDGISVYFTDGTSSNWAGGSGGTYNGCYFLNGPECLSSVMIRSGSVIDSIQFNTSFNKSTPIYGDNGGEENIINYGNNYCITKIDICSGSLINRMRFYFAPKESWGPNAGYWTRTYGSGDDDCQVFESQNEQSYINKICTQSGDYYGIADRVFGLQVGYIDNTESEFVGFTAHGQFGCYSAPNGTCFTSVNLKYASTRIGSLKFETSNGEWSPLWGNADDLTDNITLGNDYCIYKIDFCAEWMLEEIKFYFAPKEFVPTMEPTKEPTMIPTDNTIDPSISPSISPTMITSNPTYLPSSITIPPTTSPTKEPIEPSMSPTPSPTIGIWTSYYGDGTGTTCLDTFETDGNEAYINKVCTRYGSALDGIQVYFTDNTTSSYAGGNGGGYDCYLTNNDECFSSVTIRSGGYIDAVQFHTSDNESTPLWGGNGGGLDIVSYGNDYCISKINVCSGSLVERIKFYFIPKIMRLPTLQPTLEPIDTLPTSKPTITTSQPTVYTLEPTMEPIFEGQGNNAVERRYMICRLITILVSLFFMLM